MDLDSYFEELQSITDIADAYIQTIKETIKKQSEERASDAGNDTRGLLNRRFRTREVSQMIGVSESGLYKAEKEERIPKAHYEKNSVGRLVRDGWTLDQLLDIKKRSINCQILIEKNRE